MVAFFFWNTVYILIIVQDCFYHNNRSSLSVCLSICLYIYGNDHLEVNWVTRRQSNDQIVPVRD